MIINTVEIDGKDYDEVDIITIGDTVWLGTSRGVSLSVDGGTNWTKITNSTLPNHATDVCSLQ